jgi:hypothetical protein
MCKTEIVGIQILDCGYIYILNILKWLPLFESNQLICHISRKRKEKGRKEEIKRGECAVLVYEIFSSNECINLHHSFAHQVLPKILMGTYQIFELRFSYLIFPFSVFLVHCFRLRHQYWIFQWRRWTTLFLVDLCNSFVVLCTYIVSFLVISIIYCLWWPFFDWYVAFITSIM